VALFVSALEASADRWASDVVRALGRPCFGIGGSDLEALGVRLVADLRRFTAMGTVEVAARLPALLEAAAAVWDELETPPQVALLVDGPDANLPLAALLAARGVPVVYYVAPQVWAWRAHRVDALRDRARKVAVILPFEEAPLRAAGVDATFVGHPLLDSPSPSRARARDALGLGEGLVVAVAPGSRPAEVDRHLGPCLAAARLLGARAIVVPVAPSVSIAQVPGVLRVPGPAGLALAAADVAFVASGSATLEAILAGTPPVILHRTSSIGFFVARALVRVGHVGLPNLVLGRRAFPELLQDDVQPDLLARAAESLLARPDMEAIQEVRARLGTGGAAGRVADMVRSVAP